MTGFDSGEWLALQRAAFLVGPALTAALLLIVGKPKPREATAAMVAFLWLLPALLLLQLLATYFGWWTFAGQRNMLQGLPIDVWIGWAIWWGPVAVFISRHVPIYVIVLASMAIDLATMPYLSPLVALDPNWLAGDAAAMAICLTPALWIARLTRDDRLPKRRAMFHVLGWGGYMTLVIPACVLAYTGRTMTDLYRLPTGATDWCLLAAGLLLLFVGIAATAEFARVGEGTPIPFDPPKRIVVSGPYALVANPMQIISAFFMALLALYARSWGLALVAAMFAAFDAVYATWYNRAHIAKAMPDAWSRYRGDVDEWRINWSPRVGTDAFITISPSGPARWIWDRCWPRVVPHLNGNIVVDSEPRGHFVRLTYRRPGASIEDTGIKALGRILEHAPLPFAMLGWAIRFPYLGGALQRLSWVWISVWRRANGVT
jgi:protein-S-isoprenylcysteine O-methyltransferase Ste14